MNDPGLGPGTCAAPRTRADCAPGGQHRHFTPGTPSDRSSRSHDPKPEMKTTHVRVCASPGERQHQHASLHCTPEVMERRDVAARRFETKPCVNSRQATGFS